MEGFDVARRVKDPIFDSMIENFCWSRRDRHLVATDIEDLYRTGLSTALTIRSLNRYSLA